MTRIRKILEERLRASLSPEQLRVEDQSALHEGHAGARPEGETHFRVVVVSPGFEGLSRIARQRLVLEAVGDLMETRIHALSISALTPEEAVARG